MEALDKWLYEYSLVRYVPRPDRGEFINIGLIMLCKRQKWLFGKILLNPDKIKALNPDANLEFLKNQTSLFLRTDIPQKDIPVEEKYRWLAAEKSASIRVSPSHPGLIPTQKNGSEDSSVLEAEFNRLFSLLVE